MQVKQLLRYPKNQNETYHASEVKAKNKVFALYFTRFALSFQKKGGTSEVKAKNKVFALYFTRFALSLHTKKDKGSHNPRNNLIIKNFIINIAL